VLSVPVVEGQRAQLQLGVQVGDLAVLIGGQRLTSGGIEPSPPHPARKKFSEQWCREAPLNLFAFSANASCSFRL
jgi:hypothetical protein